MKSNWLQQWYKFLKDNPLLDVTKDGPTFLLPKNDIVSGADNTFWEKVKSNYPPSPVISNLNNGAVSSSPTITEQAFIRYYSLLNTSPSYYTWKIMEQGREVIREGLAHLLNVHPEEVAILRNATEALNNIIFGIHLNAGDEVVVCRQDYTKTVSSWKQRELRESIKINWVDIHPDDTGETIADKYLSALSDKTKVLQLTHVINWNGLIVPVEKIIPVAKSKNVKVILDAAHSFGLVETDLQKLECDYLATALHKWMGGPIPTGLLFVRKKEISDTWPLSSCIDPKSENIRKFEELSIQMLPLILGLGHSISFHLNVGMRNKEYRLRYLRKYWTDKLQNIAGLKWNTSLNEERCCVVINFAIHGLDAVELESILLKKYMIHVGVVHLDGLQGIRVTPNIYTQLEELDKFVHAISEIASGK